MIIHVILWCPHPSYSIQIYYYIYYKNGLGGQLYGYIQLTTYGRTILIIFLIGPTHQYTRWMFQWPVFPSSCSSNHLRIRFPITSTDADCLVCLWIQYRKSYISSTLEFYFVLLFKVHCSNIFIWVAKLHLLWLHSNTKQFTNYKSSHHLIVCSLHVCKIHEIYLMVVTLLANNVYLRVE